jgi:RNA polymerase sigma-70 factor (ECF subfamily)
VTTETWPRLRRDSTDGEVDLERDRELVAIAQAGDKSAFDVLYACYSERLERYCLRRLRDPYEAQDVTQEAFLRAWRALPTFGGERRFYPWLSVIASNLCTDVLRRRQRFGPVPMADPTERDTSTTTSAEDSALASADLDLAGQALARLSDRHRRILDLRERSGLSYQDIAQREGIRITTVETLIWRARQAFKREFQALSGPEGGLAGIPAAVFGIGFLRRMLRATGRAAGSLPSRLSAVGPQAMVTTVGGVVATAAIVVASASGGPHVHTAAPAAPARVAAPASVAAPDQSTGGSGAPKTARHVEGPAPAASPAQRSIQAAGGNGSITPAAQGGHAGGTAKSVAAHGPGTTVPDRDTGSGSGSGKGLVNRGVSVVSGVVGDAGQAVSNLENVIGSAANGVGTAVTGAVKILGGDVNGTVAALKSADPVRSLGQVLGSLGLPTSSRGPSFPGHGGTGGTGVPGASEPGGTSQPSGNPSGHSGGLLGDLLG